MAIVEVVIRLHSVDGDDIEAIQDKIMDGLYARGFMRIEPISTILVSDEDEPFRY